MSQRSASAPTRVIIADDHPIFIRGLESLLGDAGLVIAGQASDGAALLERIKTTHADLVVMDIGMPVLDGLGVLRRMQGAPATPAVLVLSLHDERNVIEEARRLGARGFVCKDDGGEAILAAIRSILAGDPWFFRPRPERFANPPPAPLMRLSAAELRVLELLSENLTSAEIAQRLGLSVRTVQNHRAHACDKLGLSGANRLLAFALEYRDQFRTMLRSPR